MSKLDVYAQLTQKRHEFYLSCTRAAGPFQLGPTNKGGIYLRFKDKDICADLSINDLKFLDLMIQEFIKEVVE